MGGLDFNALLAACYAPEPISRLRMPGQEAEEARIITVDDVLHALSEALAWVNDEVAGDAVKAALMQRLSMRIVSYHILSAPSSLSAVVATEPRLRARAPHIATTHLTRGHLFLPHACRRIPLSSSHVRIATSRGLAAVARRLRPRHDRTLAFAATTEGDSRLLVGAGMGKHK